MFLQIAITVNSVLYQFQEMIRQKEQEKHKYALSFGVTQNFPVHFDVILYQLPFVGR